MRAAVELAASRADGWTDYIGFYVGSMPTASVEFQGALNFLFSAGFCLPWRGDSLPTASLALVPMKQRNASSGQPMIGSPRMLKLVLMIAGRRCAP
jgi:hypothetical protein